MNTNTTISTPTLKQKTIKVGYKYREHCAPVNSIYRTSWVQVPKVQMEGNWLEELGFHVGEKVTVLYEEGRITLLAPAAEVCKVAEPAAAYKSK